MLAQLGFKLQHALRAFTAVDRKDIKSAAENYPITSYYKVEDAITQLGTGEAFITALNEKGIPTPLVHCMMSAPGTRMDVITPDEINRIVRSSSIATKYNDVVDRESAYELLNKKIESKQKEEEEIEEKVKKERKKLQREKKSIIKITLAAPEERLLGK